jgi:hypothetical protein
MLGKVWKRVRMLLRRLNGLEEDSARAERRHQETLVAAQGLTRRLDRLDWEIASLKLLAGRLHSERVRAVGVLQSLCEAEFRVFSQFGDDGIIQYLLHLTGAKPEMFIEFGVTDYTEANTRFLALNNNWRGLVLDGDPAMVERIRRDPICTFYDVTPVAAFIDRDNINDLFIKNGFAGEIGLLSVDIDGNDYWVWEEITAVNPVVIVCEYNSTFGPTHAVTVPYDPTFQRQKAHSSNLYYGASLAALCHLAEKKGFAFVGSNSNGNNAYFVRRDHLGLLRVLTPAEGWVDSRFRESVGNDGLSVSLSMIERLKLISDCQLVDITNGMQITAGDLLRSR